VVVHGAAVSNKRKSVTMACPLMLENVWLQQQKFEGAHCLYLRLQSGTVNISQNSSSSLAGDIAAVRQDIQKALNKPAASAGQATAGGDASVYKRLEALEKENKELRKITDELRALILTVQASVASGQPGKASTTAPAATPVAVNGHADDDDDDDMDLFGSDEEEEDAETKAEREKRLADYASRKSKKPTVIAKSSIVLDVKPWDDETDMKAMEDSVRSIAQDGLLWGASKLVPLAYGIKKLQISCVVEDDKVGIDDLTEKLTEDFEDYIQSVDIAAFNKI